MKNTFSIRFVLFSMFLLNALFLKAQQKGSLCDVPQVLNKSEITISGNKRIVSLRFAEKVPDFLLLSAKNGKLIYKKVSKNEIRFEMANLSVDFELSLENSCGEIVKTIFSRDVRKPNEDFIVVSPELGALLEKFVFGNKRLIEFLNEDSSVSFIDKLAFYQEFALDGEVIFEDGEELLEKLDMKIPDKTDGTDGGSGGEKDPYTCKCEEIRTRPFNSHQKEVGGVSPWYADLHPITLKNQGNIDVGAGGETWWNIDALGASLYQNKYSQGWKRKRKATENLYLETGDYTEDYLGTKSYIKMNFICMDGRQLPSDCKCGKEGIFDYRYDSNLHVTAKVKSGGGWNSWKLAKANVMNRVMVYCYLADEKGADISNFTPIKGMSHEASAYCKVEKDPNFWPNIQEFGEDIIDVFTNDEGELFYWKKNYKYDSTLVKIDTLQQVPIILDSIYQIDTMVVDSQRVSQITPNSQKYKDLLGSLIDVITTGYYAPFECSSGDKFKTISGSFKFRLEPNKPITFVMVSDAKHRVKGRRSWYSDSQVVSGFSMNTTTSPGDFTGPEVDCCAPWIGTYNVGGPFFSADIEKSLKLEAGENLSVMGFKDGWPNGLEQNFFNYYVRGNVGFMTRPPERGDCAVDVNERSIESLLDESDNEVENLFEFGGEVAYYDLNGRLLSQTTLDSGQERPMEIINEYARQVLPNITSVYLIRVISNGKSYSHKISIIKY